jgi:hypothetical protein
MMRRDVLPTDSRTSNSRAKVLGDQLRFSKTTDYGKVGLWSDRAGLADGEWSGDGQHDWCLFSNWQTHLPKPPKSVRAAQGGGCRFWHECEAVGTVTVSLKSDGSGYGQPNPKFHHC